MERIFFLKGKRVALALITEADAQFGLTHMNDLEVLQFLARDRPLTEEEESGYIEKARKAKNMLVFTVFSVETDEPERIGIMGLHDIDHQHGTATTGAWFAKEFRGKGYGTEAKMLLLSYAFDFLNLRHIRSDVFAFNERSYAYSEKCGYVEVGRLPGWITRKGKTHDQIIMVASRESWEPLWEEFKREHLSE